MTSRLRLTLLAFVLAAGGPALAQNESLIQEVERLHLDDGIGGPDGERAFELYVRALTRYGEPVKYLKPVDLIIRDQQELADSGEVTVSSLSATGRGMAAVIAIDTSRTMKGEPFKRAQAAALEVFELLEAVDRVAIVAFADDARVVASFSASKAGAKVELQDLEVDEQSLNTVLYDGIYESVELIRTGQNLPRRSFVIVFSDGKDGGSRNQLEQVLAYAAGNDQRPPALIFTIGYARFGGEGLRVLRDVAEKTGGEFLQATSTIHLSPFFNGIWRQMMDSYVIRFPGSMDGKDHRIEVCIEDHCDQKIVRPPDMPWPIWPFAAVGVGVLAVGGVAMLIARGRTAGRLVFQGGPLAGEVFTLRGPKLSIGALEDNDVVLPSDTVSRYHAAIHRKGRKVEIEDLDSANGTFVNGLQVRTSPLRPGDKIRIAEIDLVYER